MPNKESMVGKVFGKLLVVSAGPGQRNSSGTHYANWYCQCACGNLVLKPSYALKANSENISCGCHRKPSTLKTTHTKSKHPLYHVWAQMKGRCYNLKNKRYPDYGGRGIVVCKEWRDSFTVFYKWAISEGWEDGTSLTLDRENNDKGYSPANCRFVSRNVQQNNRRNNVKFLIYGEVLNFKTIWERYALPTVNLSTFQARVRGRGWNIYKALYTPADQSVVKKSLRKPT